MREENQKNGRDTSAMSLDFDEYKLWRGELGPFVAAELAEK